MKYNSIGIFKWNKNTPSMMATKILKNIPLVIFIDAFWYSLCFASMIVVYYVSIEASFIATFYPTIWRICHIHHASINTAIGHSWSYFIWLYALRKCLKDARFAWYSATYMECKQPTEKRFLTDVLLFTHLVHLPVAYASKTYPMNIRFA